MKPDYKNWMPKGMVASFAAGACIFLAFFLLVRGLAPAGTAKTVLSIAGAVLTLAFAAAGAWSLGLYRAFDYGGKRQMSRQIIEGTASRVHLPEGGICLDVGCGSGALSIAVAKRNPHASVIGVDRWGKEYASFSRKLCEDNARAEGVSGVRFQQGDALHLEFEDETFDAVTSNYVYHNIPVRDRQAVVLETLRTLKKGGSFVIHDIFSQSKYGDMAAFVRRLRNMGYEKVELIDTDEGLFMKKSEAAWMGLSGSALLVGTK